MAIANSRPCNSRERSSLLNWEQNPQKRSPRAHQRTERWQETGMHSPREQATAPFLCCSKLLTESITGRIKEAPENARVSRKCCRAGRECSRTPVTRERQLGSCILFIWPEH